MDSEVRTLLCVAIAGVFFILAVYYNIPYLFIAGVFFDWLPLPTGWMRIGTSSTRRPAVVVHAVVTLVVYAIGILWILGIEFLRVYFLLVWWLAVMAGIYLVVSRR